MARLHVGTPLALRNIGGSEPINHREDELMTHGRLATLGVAFAFALGLGMPAMPATAAETDIMEQLKAPKPDHEAIASYYEKEAADAKAQANLHRNMAATYSTGTSIGKSLGGPLSKHCTDLAKEYDAAAAQYTDMAKAHRDMAKAAK